MTHSLELHRTQGSHTCGFCVFDVVFFLGGGGADNNSNNVNLWGDIDF